MHARRIVIALALALSFTLTAPQAQALEEECGPQACVSGAKWASGEQLDDAARKKEAKKHRKRKDAQLTVQINGGRASVFVDGVWTAVAPALYVPIKPGKHDLEVRDGQQVRARGVLTVPTSGGDIIVRVF